MEFLSEALPILIYVLLAVLLVYIIILVSKLIKTVDKTNSILDDIEEKSQSLNNLFYMIDSVSDTIASINEKVVDRVIGLIKKIFIRKKGKEDEDYE